MVQINQPAPAFDLEAYQNNNITRVKLAELRGKWVILFFYPADFTFVCPTELAEMADNYDTFKSMNAEVLSASTDTVFVHKAWHDSSVAIGKIGFPMMADPTGSLSRNYGVMIEAEGLALRGTFIIDPDGVVKSFEVNDNSIGRSAGELIRKLQAAQFVREHGGEVCPASWRPGAKTLKPGLDLVGKI
ncbi:MAG TPA: alkyl hydroperoxide reductase subunit C [candidate division Zixibacteria bacterium]|nr:alkyl hydroperoxide reductase subunit C [candidate division Zixibacteria bacterium]